MLLCAVSVPLTCPNATCVQVRFPNASMLTAYAGAVHPVGVFANCVAAAANVAVDAFPVTFPVKFPVTFPVTFPDRFPLIVCVKVLLPVQLLLAASRLLLLLVMSDRYATVCVFVPSYAIRC